MATKERFCHRCGIGESHEDNVEHDFFEIGWHDFCFLCYHDSLQGHSDINYLINKDDEVDYG